MTLPRLTPSRCAICRTTGNAAEVFPARLASDAFRPEIFSARREPDRVHYRMVRCRACGLVRSDPTADAETVAAIYSRSGPDASDETENLIRTYGRYLADAGALLARRESLLEIGCGSGFLLAEALRQGWTDVHGVEPSLAAASQAPAGIRDRIRVGVLERGVFPAESFDLICLFQVLDHLPDPFEALVECRRLLRPGGMVLCLNHDMDAPSARLLGSLSPIVDVEHTYLFGSRTLRRLLEACGFRVERIGSVWNRYSMRYLLRLLPLPGPLKAAAGKIGSARLMRETSLAVPLGNQFALGRRPAMPASSGGEGA
jgi:SAM-dependent methyltransferase